MIAGSPNLMNTCRSCVLLYFLNRRNKKVLPLQKKRLKAHNRALKDTTGEEFMANQIGWNDWVNLRTYLHSAGLGCVTTNIEIEVLNETKNLKGLDEDRLRLKVETLVSRFMTQLNIKKSDWPQNIGAFRACYDNLERKATDIVKPLIKNNPNLPFYNLKECQCKAIPSCVLNANHLTSLKLEGCSLFYIPPQIQQLNNLEILDLSKNRLSELPAAFATLTNLKTLDISDNFFESLPECVTACRELTSLEISNNKISSLPKSIGRLDKLENFIANNNPISELPSSIYLLINLKEFSLVKTALSDLDGFGLPELHTLKLSSSTISKIPEFGSVPKLKLLQMQYNTAINSINETVLSIGDRTKIKIDLRGCGPIQTASASLKNLIFITTPSPFFPSGLPPQSIVISQENLPTFV
jgi:Leucine-rich repeat (LRR) protein